MKKLSIDFCLRELADNIALNRYYLRIGLFLLSFRDVGLDTESGRPNTYEVYDMESDRRYEYTDLLQAICKFIALVG